MPQVTTLAHFLDWRGTIRNNQSFNLQEAEAAGRSLGVRIVSIKISGEADFDAAFDAVLTEGAGAILVSSSQFFIDHRYQLVALAAKHRLPAIYQNGDYVKAGGLMSYGPSTTDMFRQFGVYTGRVLKGEKPAELPVLQPTRFEFVVNLQIAKAFGLTIPPGLLAIADSVIE